MPITLDDLRRYTVARNFFKPTTLKRALQRMGFVQADPIRSPARAQDLILRQRVKDYHAGDLEHLYPTLDIEEDFFIIYGFVTRSLQKLMHPRPDDLSQSWYTPGKKRTRLLLEFVRARGEVHPREVDEYFSHGTVKNYWGGSSNATTHLLDAMHYRGLLRIARREKGIRVYSAQQHDVAPTDPVERQARLDALVNVLVRIYAPMPAVSFSSFVRQLRYAAPQWQGELTNALERAKQRLSQANVDGTDWYWPSEEKALGHTTPEVVRLLAPFDPLVRDRVRFQRLWGWEYRFEAYTPAVKRKLGYYAMPMLWRDRVIGWGNLTVKSGDLKVGFGYVASAPRDRAFKRELESELERIRAFLRI